MRSITPCLWFDTESEEAARFYTELFADSRITHISHFGPAGPRAEGLVMAVEFEIGEQSFVALNGGPAPYRFSEALSLQVSCESQDEVDRYWDGLTRDGGEEGPCGWCKDRFGVSWQIIPTRLTELLKDPDAERAQRAMKAMLEMRKIVIAELEAAAG